MPFAHTCPFLLDSDKLSIKECFVVEDSLLHDLPAGVAHHINQPGRQIVYALQQGNTFGELRSLASEFGIGDSQLHDMLGFLNLAGALKRKRRLLERIVVLRHTVLQLLLGLRYAPLSWRKSFSAATLLLAILRASWILLLAIVCVCAEIVIGNLLPISTVITFGLTGITVFVCSMYVHELAHAFVIKMQGVEPSILQRGMRLGIIHQQLTPQVELQSSLVGPLCGVGFCMAIGCMLLTTTDNGLLALLAIIIASFHMLSLLPWYGDGQSLRKALNAKKVYQ